MIFPPPRILFYFNPRSREGSDDQQLSFFLNSASISIHAPARGATEIAAMIVSRHFISIHVPARGATMHHLFLKLFETFQSTLPRGERQNVIRKFEKATKFQSTLPRGERPSRFMSIHQATKFQSTLPRGERQPRNMKKC